MATLLKKPGYDTLCLGKWHLGDQSEFLPTRHGFDHYFGIPYSEDMTARTFRGRVWPELPLLRDEVVVEAPVDARLLAKRLTAEAVKFIGAHRTKPFFLYFPEVGPGSRAEPYPGPEFAGKSANGGYGDMIEELDWSAGEILKALKENGLERNTIVVWTSDNGAVERHPPQGSNAPYRGMGYNTSEGAQRMPCIALWPGKIPAGTVCDEVCTMMDFVPTFVKLADTPGPRQEIDGCDIRDLLFAKAGAKSLYDERGFFYYEAAQLQAVRAGSWKLYLPLKSKAGGGKAAPKGQSLALYDVRTDLGEAHEVSSQHPDIVAKAPPNWRSRPVISLAMKTNLAAVNVRPVGWKIPVLFCCRRVSDETGTLKHATTRARGSPCASAMSSAGRSPPSRPCNSGRKPRAQRSSSDH